MRGGASTVLTAGEARGAAPLSALAPRWHLLESEAASGARNMALDAALLAHARRTGEATLRTYTWSRPTLSLGRHERARGLYDAVRLAAQGVDVVRRPTGGRALLHHHELTYSVTAPVGGLSLVETCAAINDLLRAALAALGVLVTVAARGPRALRPDGSACFAAPAPGELTVAGRKLVGSAQLREDGAFLQHGSILLKDDQAMIATLRTLAVAAEASHSASDDVPAPTLPAATLSETLGRPVAASEVRDALGAVLRAVVGPAGVLSPPDSPSLRTDLARLEVAFRAPAWTWRR
jgi:lipoate-protein ligase A